MQLPSLQHAKLLTLSLAAAILAGCAQTADKSPASAENGAPAVSEDAETVCLLPSKQLSGEQLTQVQAALSAGIRSAGLNVEVLEADGTAEDCDLCLGFVLAAKDKTLLGIQFQVFEDGKPFIAANGPAQNGQLQLRMVGLYAKSLMEHYLKVKSDPESLAALQQAEQQGAAAPAQQPAQK